MAWIGTMPGSTDLGPGQAARRNPTDDGWEGYHMVTTEEMDEKADVDSLATVATSGDYNDLLNTPSTPSTKRIETYLGTTNASGDYTVTYDTPFDVVPDVQPQIQAGTPSQVVRITNSTTTGFTVQVTQRNTVTLLGIEVLLGTTVAVNNSSVGVLVTER